MTGTQTEARSRVSRLRRDPDDRVVAGVCAAVARELGIDPLIVRVAVIGATFAGGAGVVMYVLGWLLIPSVEDPQPRAERREGGVAWRVAGGMGLMVLGLLLFVRQLGLPFNDTLAWPFVVAATGTALIWYRSASGRPREPHAATPLAAGRRSFPITPLRAGLGAVLVVAAALLFLFGTGALGGIRDTILWLLAVVAALALILTPLLWRLGTTLGEERAERIRTQERAEMAAHLHDSVLQTLALMQRRADDPRAVATLARRQERELRGWLWGGAQNGTRRLAGALEDAAAEVEEAHGVPIDVVAVGDMELDERGAAVVAAAREAMVNAAKFAPTGPISVYTEAEGGALHVFIRDRGAGFDPQAVPADRHGIRESIVGRMARHGGRAAVRSGPEGTEVELVMGAGS